MNREPSRADADASAQAGLPIRFTLVSDEHSMLLDPHVVAEPPRVLKTSEVVAQRVVADIVSRGLTVGDRLPGENEMLQEYGVSRESLREGLRLLEVQGLITIRRGPGGGPAVAAVDPRNLARTSTLYFHLAGANYDDLFEAWRTIEPAVVRLVTDNVDRATKRKALAPFMPSDDNDTERDRFVSRNNAFHAVIAQLSGNRVLTLVLQALSHIVVEHVMLDLDPLHEQSEISHDHEVIGQAIIDGKGARAARLMDEHIAHVNDFYRTHFPQRVRDLVQWR